MTGFDVLLLFGFGYLIWVLEGIARKIERTNALLDRLVFPPDRD